MKYRVASVICVLAALWFAYSATLGIDAGDPAGMALSLSLTAFGFALAITPQFLFDKVQIRGLWDHSRVAKGSLVLAVVGNLLLLTGVAFFVADHYG